MASVNLHASAPLPTLRDKIKLFEGRSTSGSDLGANNPHKHPMSFSSPLLVRSAKVTLGESPRRPSTSIDLHPHAFFPTTTTTHTTEVPNLDDSLPPSPPKWNVITVQGEHTHKPRGGSGGAIVQEKGKEKEKEKEVPVLALDNHMLHEIVLPSAVRMPVLATSPRRPSMERKYEEEVVKLKRMTTEEKQMVKALVKLTNRKNKMIDSLETNIQREREALLGQVEAEKTALSAKLQILDADLATKSRELAAEAMRSDDLAETIQQLERERQEIRLSLAAAKRESRQCRQSCDAELAKKTQSLLDMATQLNALTCLRQSMNCVICEEKVAVVVLHPCRHMVLCGGCCLKVVKCPMCRVDIRSKFEVFTNWDI